MDLNSAKWRSEDLTYCPLRISVFQKFRRSSQPWRQIPPLGSTFRCCHFLRVPAPPPVIFLICRMGLLKSTLQGRLKEGRYPGRAARGGPQWVLDEHPIPSQQPWGAPGPLVPAPHHDLLSRAWGGRGSDGPLSPLQSRWPMSSPNALHASPRDPSHMTAEGTLSPFPSFRWGN